MPGSKGNTSIFSKVIRSRHSVSNVFGYGLAESIDLESAAESDKKLIVMLRKMINRRNDTIRPLTDADTLLVEARSLIDCGDVGAVDGTNAFSPIDLMNFTTLGVSAIWMTTQQTSDPNISVTYSSTQYRDPSELSSEAAILDLCRELDRGRDDHSWQRTFREYVERECAMTCPANWVMIDGPIFTQNLLTQEVGRALLDRMMREDTHWMGVIKDLRQAQSIVRNVGMALEPGEYCIVGSSRSGLKERFDGVDDSWLNDWDAEERYVRVVYRPKNKAFCVECLREDVEMVLAILVDNQSKALNHELPILMELVDAKCRAENAAKAVSDNLRQQVMREDYKMGVDVSDEREMR